MVTRELLPVYVSWTKGVKGWEAESLVAGMKDMLSFAALKPEIKVFGSAAWGASGEDYSSPDWYQEHNLIQLPGGGKGRGTQISAPGLWMDLAQEPWRKAEPHLDFMIFDRDMNKQILNEKTGKNEWINFIFGQGGDLGTTISVYRFRYGVEEPKHYPLVLKHIGCHEFGHVLGLVRRKTESADWRGGLYGSHCLNLCSMRQSMSVDQALDLTLKLEKEKIILCKDCQKELMVK